MGLTEPDIAPERFLEDVELRIGDVVDVEPFPEARKPVYKLRIDLGEATLRSAAGLTDLYEPDDLVGAQVVCACNLGTVSIAGFESECLVTGVDGEGGVVHLTTERPVEPGARVY
ncbi:MAG: tRNA-binding protein [Halobacteriales archaeon]